MDLKLDYNLDCHFESFCKIERFMTYFMKLYRVAFERRIGILLFDLQTINPFLSKEVAEFMFKIPYNLKIKMVSLNIY